LSAPDTIATGLILTSALLHASWNAGVKKAPDKFAAMVFISGIGGLLFLPFAPLVPLPTPELWGWIAASLCIHLFYQRILSLALEAGDLTFTYPVARGTGPMLVALFSYFFLKGEMSLFELGAVGVLVGGIFATAGASRKLTADRAQFRTALLYAALAGCLIACYTVVDGLAVRRAENPFTYVVWSGLAFVPVLTGYARLRHGRTIFTRAIAWWKVGLPLSIIAQGGYGLALYAYSLGALGEIAALRETSIIFASLIGYFWLKEAFSRRKTVAVLMIALGAVLLKST